MVISSKGIDMNDMGFKEYEVEYNLVYRILEDKNAFVIQSQDKDFIAVQNKGRAMWIWMSPTINDVQVNGYITEFCELIKESEIPGITGYKGIIESD